MLIRRPGDCYPAAEAGSPPRIPLGGGGRGEQVPASFALFSSSSPFACYPSPPPTILSTISGEAGLIFLGRPLSLHLGGRGPADT